MTPSAQRAAEPQAEKVSGARLVVEALEREASAGASVTDAWQAAAKDCVRAADETAPLVPKLGRARPLAERSVGTPDPGAVSLGLIVTAIGEQLADRPTRVGAERGRLASGIERRRIERWCIERRCVERGGIERRRFRLG